MSFGQIGLALIIFYAGYKIGKTMAYWALAKAVTRLDLDKQKQFQALLKESGEILDEN